MGRWRLGRHSIKSNPIEYFLIWWHSSSSRRPFVCGFLSNRSIPRNSWMFSNEFDRLAHLLGWSSMTVCRNRNYNNFSTNYIHFESFRGAVRTTKTFCFGLLANAFMVIWFGLQFSDWSVDRQSSFFRRRKGEGFQLSTAKDQSNFHLINGKFVLPDLITITPLVELPLDLAGNFFCAKFHSIFDLKNLHALFHSTEPIFSAKFDENRNHIHRTRQPRVQNDNFLFFFRKSFWWSVAPANEISHFILFKRALFSNRLNRKEFFEIKNSIKILKKIPQ